MLILTRRPNESVMIGDNVTVTVLGVRGNQVRLGITAPVEIAVHREEVYKRIQERGNGVVESFTAGIASQRRQGVTG